MPDPAFEYKLMTPVAVSRGDSLIDKNVVLGVLWLVSAMVFAIPLWILLSADETIREAIGFLVRRRYNEET